MHVCTYGCMFVHIYLYIYIYIYVIWMVTPQELPTLVLFRSYRVKPALPAARILYLSITTKTTPTFP